MPTMKRSAKSDEHDQNPAPKKVANSRERFGNVIPKVIASQRWDSTDTYCTYYSAMNWIQFAGPLPDIEQWAQKYSQIALVTKWAMLVVDSRLKRGDAETDVRHWFRLATDPTPLKWKMKAALPYQLALTFLLEQGYFFQPVNMNGLTKEEKLTILASIPNALVTFSTRWKSKGALPGGPTDGNHVLCKKDCYLIDSISSYRAVWNTSVTPDDNRFMHYDMPILISLMEDEAAYWHMKADQIRKAKAAPSFESIEID